MSRELEISLVQTLGKKIGYGNMMHIAEKLWRERLEKDGMGGGEFKIGCCASNTVPCGCRTGCDWCCGSGWLTRKCKTEKVLAEYLDELRAKLDESALEEILEKEEEKGTVRILPEPE
jgi:hypothetical protein